MNNCKIFILDEVNCYITGLSQSHIDHFYDQLGVSAPGYFFSPKYKLGIWDGKIRYFTKNSKTYVNLLEGIVPDLIKFGYDVELVDQRKQFNIIVPTVDSQMFSHLINPHTGQSFEMRDYQVELVQTLFDHGNGIGIAATGSGKALSLDSKILTVDGWIENRNLNIGDQLITPSNTITKITNIYPQPLKQLYKITFYDGSTVETCLEHLWLAHVPKKTHTAKTQKQIITTQDMLNFYNRKMSGIYTPGNISIPVTDAIEYTNNHDTLPLDPYILGLLIGDGTLVTNTLIFSNTDEYILSQMQQYVSKLCIDLKRIPSSICDYNLSHHQGKRCTLNIVTKIIKDLKLNVKSNLKFIPSQYKTASIQDRWEIIRGLFDTDGTVSKHHITFTTVSKQLAKDVQEIIWSLGGLCRISSRIPTYTYKGEKKTGQLAYTCSVRHKVPKNFFNTPIKRNKCNNVYGDGRYELTRKIVSIEASKVDYSQCISVDSEDKLYITNDFIVTHNTLIAAAISKGYEIASNFRSIIIVPDKNLTEQTRNEYAFFGLDVGEYSGTRKQLSNQHLVATWQALQNNPTIVQDYQVIICDECQGLKSTIIKGLLNEYGKDIPIRFGLTGTLPKEPSDALAIKIAVGDVRYTIPAHKLIQQKHLSNLNIDILQLEVDLTKEYEEYVYSTSNTTIKYKEFCEQYVPDWGAEQRFVQHDEERINWIAQDINNQEGNTLCLVTNIKFGKKLAKAIPGAIFLYGKDKTDIRNQVYDSFKDNNNVKVVANLQIASTGLNIPRIFNLYLIDIGKSFVRTIQSIGRGLRKAHDKDFVKVVDICSSLKYSNKHMRERIKYYKEAKYPHVHKKIRYKVTD